MNSKAYQSKLIPYFDFIASSRRKRVSWRSIAALLKSEHGVKAAPSSIYAFFCSYRAPKRRVPVGYPEEIGTISNPANTVAETKAALANRLPQVDQTTQSEWPTVKQVRRTRSPIQKTEQPCEEKFTTGPDIVS